MLSNLKEREIAPSLIPRCPICGKEMTTNLRIDECFVEDEGWHKAQKIYHEFLEESENKKILFLELGVGFNTPIIIKIPFIKMTYEYKDSFHIPISKGQSYLLWKIQNKSLPINCDFKTIIEGL